MTLQQQKSNLEPSTGTLTQPKESRILFLSQILCIRHLDSACMCMHLQAELAMKIWFDDP